MPRSGLSILVSLALLGGCTGDGRAPARGPAHEPAATDLTVEAMDGVTNEALVDDSFTVRYLARAPITLDATAVEQVPSTQGYRIGHDVSADSLVVELRLEAPSYERLDTVLAVAWGSSLGTVRIPLMPRADRTAAAAPPGGRETPAPAPANRTPVSTPGEVDRSPLEAGDRAFTNADWAGAARAYARMPVPSNREGEYALDYELALVRLGISHINLGQWSEAHDVLQRAVSFDFREYTAFFYLGQVQCVLGQYDAGRQSLTHIPEWLTLSISEAQRPVVLALIDYQLAMCTYGESRQARTQSDLRRLRDQAMQEFQRFIDQALTFSPLPPELQAAVADAQQRMAEIRAPNP